MNNEEKIFKRKPSATETHVEYQSNPKLDMMLRKLNSINLNDFDNLSRHQDESSKNFIVSKAQKVCKEYDYKFSTLNEQFIKRFIDRLVIRLRKETISNN